MTAGASGADETADQLPPPRRHADSHDGPQVRNCPFCGRGLAIDAFVQEYWTGSTRNFHIWCPDCAVVAEVVTGGGIVSHEPAH